MSIINPAVLSSLAEAVGGLLQQTGAGAAASPLRRDSALDPGTVLLDLRLPASVLEMLSPILKLLGFELDEYTLEDTMGLGDQRKVHRCRLDGVLELFLIHIPKWILERNGNNDRAAVDYLRHSFSEGARVYVISEEVDALKIAFKGTLTAWRVQGKINAVFIPWELLQDLQRETFPVQVLTPSKRQGYLKLIFELDDVIEPGKPAASMALDDTETKQFIAILVKKAGTSGLEYKAYFSDLIKNSNLPMNWQTERIAALVGNPETDASNLVKWAVAAGTNTSIGRQSHTVLAELMQRLMDAVGLEDQKILKRWVVNKPLISDQAARDAFCEKFPVETK